MYLSDVEKPMDVSNTWRNLFTILVDYSNSQRATFAFALPLLENEINSLNAGNDLYQVTGKKALQFLLIHVVYIEADQLKLASGT